MAEWPADRWRALRFNEAPINRPGKCIQKPGRRGRAEPMLGKPGDGGVQREREGRGGPSRTVRQSLCRG